MNPVPLTQPWAAPYKLEPTTKAVLHEVRDTDLGGVEVTKNTPHWTASDVQLLLESSRLISPYTLDQLKKIHVFIGLLIEMKEGSR